MCPFRQPKPTESGKAEAILDAALALFAERGFHGTAVPLVAERAGVGAGTLYRYFDSKEALVNALYRREKQRFGAALLTAVSPDKPTRAQFHDMWRGMARYVAEQRSSIAFMELHHHGPYIDAESRAVEDLVLTPVRAFIKDAQRRQILKPIAAEIIVALVYGAFTGLVKQSWEGRLKLTPSVLDQAEACVWEAIRA